MIDDELRIAPYVETPHSKFDGDLQAVDEGFILGCVVGGSEVKTLYHGSLEEVSELAVDPSPLRGRGLGHCLE